MYIFEKMSIFYTKISYIWTIKTVFCISGKKFHDRLEIFPITRSRVATRRLRLRPCIPNLNLNVWVGIRVGTSFLRFPKFDFNVIFGMFGNPCFRLKNRFFWPKNRNLFPNLFPKYFREILASSKILFFLVSTQNIPRPCFSKKKSPRPATEDFHHLLALSAKKQNSIIVILY